MQPISAWTATSQHQLESGKLLQEIDLKDYKLKIIVSGFCLWIVSEWPKSGQIAFRAAFAAIDNLSVENISEEKETFVIQLKGETMNIKVVLDILDNENALFRYTTFITPAFDMLIPYWPRDIMPLFKSGKTQKTEGKIHASQVGTRSGILFFSLEKPRTGSVFYFQNLSALKDYCVATETSAGDLVGGVWPEIGMKLPITNVNKPLKGGTEYIISDAFVKLDNSIPKDNYEMTQQYMNHMAAVYLLLPRPETKYQDWPDMLHKSLDGLENHKGCWQFADGNAYLNAYVCDYKTPPEIMVQLAVLLPLLDFDKWSGENHSRVIKTLENGLEKFYDKELKTIVRWLPSLQENLDWSEEQKKPEVMDSWYLHHPMLNLSRLAKSGNKIAEKLLLDSIDYVIKVAHNFDYQWPVFYKMATLEILKAETEEGQGGEKDVPGIYALLMLQVWEITGDKKYFEEAVKAAKKLEGLGFDIFYQANNTAFSAGALLRLYKETKNEIYLNLSYLCIAAILKNVQLWECNYGNAKNFPNFFAIYPLKDAPYTAAYEEQEVYAGIQSYLEEAEGLDILPSVKLLLAELIKHVINRVSYYFPPKLPKDILMNNKEVKTGEIDPDLWIALEDLQDGWNQSGQVGQEVYGAGIAFGIVPRQYYKVKNSDFMVFTEYPAKDFTLRKNSLTFSVLGNKNLTFRLVLISANKKPLPNLELYSVDGRKKEKIIPLKNGTQKFTEYQLYGDCKFQVIWK